MAKKPKRDDAPKFIVQMVRPDVPDLVKRLATLLEKEKGVPVGFADAASIAVREAVERRAKR